MGESAKVFLLSTKLDALRLDTLVERKILQKTIYFLQEFGIHLGYAFGFYVYGPYSSELTDDAFLLKKRREQAPETIETVELSVDEEKALSEARKFFAEIKGDSAEIAHQLELLSSLHFLWKISYSKNKPAEDIFEKLKKMKHIQDDTDLKPVWQLIVDYGLAK